MDNNIGSILDWPQQDRRCDRIIDDQRYSVLVGDSSELLDVADISSRVADTFTENRTRLVVDQSFYRIRMIRLRESDGNSLAWQNVSEERVGSSVKLRG